MRLETDGRIYATTREELLAIAKEAGYELFDEELQGVSGVPAEKRYPHLQPAPFSLMVRSPCQFSAHSKAGYTRMDIRACGIGG